MTTIKYKGGGDGYKAFGNIGFIDTHTHCGVLVQMKKGGYD